jgi:hypothetical protein
MTAMGQAGARACAAAFSATASAGSENDGGKISRQTLIHLNRLAAQLFVRDGRRNARAECDAMARISRSSVPANGFYAFESALHVFPLQSVGNVYGLDGWNAPDIWVGCYEDLANGCFFFAQDIFGNQFCIKGNDICSFDAETGATKELASNLDGWAAAILSDYQFLTGHKLAYEWQVRNGRIPDNKRLAPKIPFVGGGAYAVDNLYAGDTITSLRYRGEFAVQIRDVPDGGKIRLRLVD